MGSLTIILNGEEKQTHSGNVLQLVYELNLQVDHIIVELNNTIIPPKDIPTTMLKNHDKVEIIRYIGGGT
ncbi:MAG: sulfur carrier protein ThiS [Candidatus Margulisiibacteriota bacterium]|nr:sulfur carrier protein ThiS [Candidatus Margulisiibacteriota bacterium]